MGSKRLVDCMLMPFSENGYDNERLGIYKNSSIHVDCKINLIELTTQSGYDGPKYTVV